MKKTLTAGVTAIALALTAPTTATAEGISEDQVGKFLFGMIATVAIASALKNRDRGQRAATVQTAPEPIHVPQTIAPQVREVAPRQQQQRREGHIGVTRNQSMTQSHRHSRQGRATANVIPRDCVRVAETRFGNHRFFARRCLQHTYDYFDTLPNACRVRLIDTQGRTRNGYDPQCLRDYGYRARR